MAKLQYSIVEFTNEGAVAVISSQWINEQGTKCFWPNVLGKSLEKFLRSHRIPSNEPGAKWKEYSCRIIGYCDNYDQAKLKCKKAEHTSELESTSTETPRRRPKVAVKTKPAFKPTFRSKRVSPASSSASSRAESSSNDSNNSSLTKQADKANESRPFLQLNEDFLNGHRPEGRANSFVGTVDENSPVASLTTQPEKVCTTGTEQNRFEQYVVKSLISINADIQELLRRTAKKEPTVSPCEITIPVRTVEEFENLKEWIEDETNFNKLANQVCIVGGSCKQDATIRILSELIHDSAALQLSLTGKGKNSISGFRGSKLVTFVHSAVCKTSKGKGVEKHEIETFIKKWLKNTSDRNGGREKRRGKQIQSSAVTTDAVGEQDVIS